MLVRDIDVVRSPTAPDRARLRGEVLCQDPRVPPEVYWFDVPREYRAYLSESGNPWLALLLPFAVHLREPLSIPSPVDETLYMNVHELMRVWKCWYPQLDPVPVEAMVSSSQAGEVPSATGALFSGGVDAWFTVLTHSGESALAGQCPIDDLLCVWGLDVSLDHPEDFGVMRDTLAEATSDLAVNFLDVATNLHQAKWWREADWARVAHGAGLASIALALEHRYARLLVPSTHRYDDLVPWGSHPLTDPLLSTRATRIVHDGAGFSRVEKTETLAKSDAALNSLQVCWETASYRNCEACVKCYRTMTTLWLLGALERCPRFTATTIDLKRLAKVFSRDDSDRAFLRELRTLAIQKGRHDVARAIQRSLKHSRQLERYLRVTSMLATKRLVWRLQAPLERWLLSDSIAQ
jgi:hypothetical protein